MRVDLWLTPSGQAKIGAGREANDFDLGLSGEGLNMESQGWRKIDTLIIEASQLPNRDECIRLTLERLSEQEQKLREKLNEDIARIDQMRSELLAIEAPRAQAQHQPEGGDDIPF